jgi:hypothetical protein
MVAPTRGDSYALRTWGGRPGPHRRASQGVAVRDDRGLAGGERERLHWGEAERVTEGAQSSIIEISKGCVTSVPTWWAYAACRHS